MTFKIIRQTEASECGIACLAMIANAYGSRETLSGLRRRFPTSLHGSTLRSLVLIASALGLNSRPLRVELDELHRIETPALLHWSMDHYVILTRISGGAAWVADPARGLRKLPLAEVSKNFTGVALEFSPAPSFKKAAVVPRVRLSDLWTKIFGLKRLLFQVFLLSLLLQVVGLLSPLANQLVIDDVMGRGDRELLVAIMIGFGGLALIQMALENLRGFVQLHASQRLATQLAGNVLRHLLNLPIPFFERRHIGDVVSRFGSLGPAQSFVMSGIIGVLLDAIMVVPVAIVMVMYSPLLSGLVLINLLVIFAVRAAAFPTVRRLSEEGMVLSAETDSVFMESIRGARAIKLAARESERHSLWQNAVAEQQNSVYRQASFTLWGRTGMGAWQTVHGLAMLYFGALQVMDGNISLGMFFAFQSYAGQFSSRIMGLIGAFFTFRMLGLHLERLADIINADEEENINGPSFLEKPLAGRIELSNVSFSYGSFDAPALSNCNVVIEPGQSVAIVGPSGGGKSTLLKVMLGLYPPGEGSVLYDGRSIGSLGPRAVRDQIGVVMQDDQLLSGSITENVAFFDAGIDMKKVEQACVNAEIHDDILRMPMGYNTLIGDMGSSLSGGQKQRLLLARALYKSPSIVFMDEGTANLDPDLERRVLARIRGMGVTRIMVAHRAAAVQGVDRILRVERGVLTDITPDVPAPPAVSEPEKVSA